MNIIYEVDKQNLRLINFNPNQTYQLDELVFYIPIKYKDATPFLLINDSEGNKDILKLSNIQKEKAYILYSVSLTNTITTTDGVADIRILLIDQEIVKSISQNIKLSYENYIPSQQIVLIENLSHDIKQKYQLIEQMTKMNIDIYQTIKEGVNS